MPPGWYLMQHSRPLAREEIAVYLFGPYIIKFDLQKLNTLVKLTFGLAGFGTIGQICARVPLRFVFGCVKVRKNYN